MREKKEFIQICGKIELQNKIYARGDLYELQTFYHRRVLLSMGIIVQSKCNINLTKKLHKKVSGRS